MSLAAEVSLKKSAILCKLCGLEKKLVTVEAAYMGRLRAGYSCLLYPLSLLPVVQ